MRYLIDTHVFIWFMEASPKFSPVAKSLMLNKNNDVFLSIASLWEISIKQSIGKLPTKHSYSQVAEILEENLMQILPISFEHTDVNNKLPFHHRDPFDRLIAAQAIVENLDFISADPVFDKYFQNERVKRIW